MMSSLATTPDASTAAVCDHPINDYASVLHADGVLVDVRNPDELVTGSLPGALNVPLGEFAQRISEFDQQHQVVLFCRSGGRSGQAAQFLCDNGFSRVVNLAGGMLAWDADH
jgi:rhodanese-related sulfurtransferase